MADNKGMCFVIMPISDPDGYDKGHFESVYKDIFAPAIEKAGYTPHRVDEDASSGLIQAKIIENLINAPMAICDLSTRNPNVLFELGIRQAYDKPVVLVQESGTERIFDINGISCIDYDPSLIYRSVLDSQEKIANAIQETEKNPQYNSLITALSIPEAQYAKKDIDSAEIDTLMLRNIYDKLDSLNASIQMLKHQFSEDVPSFFLAHRSDAEEAFTRYEYENYVNLIRNIKKLENRIEEADCTEEEKEQAKRKIRFFKRRLKRFIDS